MKFDESGFAGFLSILITLVIICFVANAFLKSFNRQAVPVVDSNGTVSVRLSGIEGGGPAAVVQRVKEQVAIYNRTVNDRVNYLLNASEQQ